MGPPPPAYRQTAPVVPSVTIVQSLDLEANTEPASQPWSGTRRNVTVGMIVLNVIIFTMIFRALVFI